ncbi:MAG TPA: hypothetical protein VFX60_12915 [Micromonospora sp.]|nr:hypothetical protein [Micromonospora sp.]
MGEFIAVSAFKTEDAGGVLAATGRFFSTNGWPADAVENSEPVSGDDVRIFPPVNGWTVVVWPEYFLELAAVEFVSRDLGALASTVSIHDGDYWRHVLLRDGVTLDRFASEPGYFSDDPEDIARLATRYAGRPDLVAEAVGRPVEQVAPYLIHVPWDDGEDEDGSYDAEPELGRAFPDDEFELDSPWVFVDFWRRIGPRYPENLSPYADRLRLAPGWLEKLPHGDAER